jgi:signal transduction histidine kinase
MPDDALTARAARASAVRALAAELGHDLQGPLNLFRLMTERLGAGQALDDEDVALLREELERLSALNARLRSLARDATRPSLQKEPCTPAQLVEGALSLCSLSSPPSPLTPGPSPLALKLELPTNVTLACDQRLLTVALAELIDNAWAAKSAHAGVRFSLEPAPGFCVWDDGPGFELSPERAMAWGATTKVGAVGLGLTLALRAARAHGFQLELERSGTLSQAWLLIPARELQPPQAKVTA